MTILKDSDNTEFGLLKFKDYIKFYYFKRTLLIGMRDPSKVEIKAFKSGNVIINLVIKPNVIFIVFKIGNLDWSDIAYSFYLDLIKKDENYEEKLQESYPIQFNLVLFDVYTGKVKVKRLLTFSDEFAKILRDEVLKQYKKPLMINDYKAEVNKIYKDYFSSHLASNKFVRATCLISSENLEEIRDVVYDRYGYGTNKVIPRWIYKEIHNPKIYGIITKEQIPEDLLQRGISKCTYKKKQGKYWTVVLYKTKKVKKKMKKGR